MTAPPRGWIPGRAALLAALVATAFVNPARAVESAFGGEERSAAPGEIRVLDAVSHPTHGAPVGVVYLRIENRGALPDRLVSVESSAAASCQVHETVRDGDTMRMKHRPTLEIPAGGSVVLEHGGLHVMLMGLAAPLRAGQEIQLGLHFERAGRVELAVPVVEAGHAH